MLILQILFYSSYSGLADPKAVRIALTTLDAVQLVGMPESDCIIAQAAVYLARAPKSREINDALARCKADINDWKGPLPAVPLHLRNAPTKLMKDLSKFLFLISYKAVVSTVNNLW